MRENGHLFCTRCFMCAVGARYFGSGGREHDLDGGKHVEPEIEEDDGERDKQTGQLGGEAT